MFVEIQVADIVIRYIKWAQETIVSGGEKVKTIMKRCCDAFSHDVRYKENKQYLHVWIKYVRGRSAGPSIVLIRARYRRTCAMSRPTYSRI